VLYARIDGSINPAQEDLLRDALQTCVRQDHAFLLLGIDTPGGLGKSMREMVQTILNAPVPVVTWVGPKGARAASAGVFIVAASMVASMSPQTTIGAASPVAAGGKDIPETMAKKIKNDILSLIRGVAKARGRNVEWYEKAVEEAASITASEAAQNRVVDLVATSPQDLLEQLGSRTVEWDDRSLSFDGQTAELIPYEPGFRHGFLSWLLNPQIAYFLLMGGLAGLFFELSNPGAIFPGVLGGMCLLLGLYAMAILPTNVAGILLILFSLVLFLLEIAVTSFGLLSLGGVLCLFFGSLILFRFEYGMAELPLTVVISTVVGVSLLVAAALFLVTRAQMQPRHTGSEAMLGLTGEVTRWEGRSGQIRVRGELWKARNASGEPLEPGAVVRVKDMQGLTLIVEQSNVSGNDTKE
jgi:membrane-bound serine protease (ClpP class)